MKQSAMGWAKTSLAFGAMLALSACGVIDTNSSGTGSSAAAAPITIGATVSGLAGTGLVLQNNGSDNLPVSSSGAVTFAAQATSGSTYGVTVLAQPSGPSQTCTVTGGTGTVTSTSITGVAVNCRTNSFPVGGSVSGLAGSGLVLHDSAGDNLAVAANGSFTFATPIASGEPYNVTVLTQPASPNQSCTVTGGSGTIDAGPVATVVVSCVAGAPPAFSISGTVTGLVGTGLVLQNNIADNLRIFGNGPFTFSGLIPGGGTYSVAATAQPTNPSQTCTVGNGTGTVTSANVVGIGVACATNSYSVGVTVSGLVGSGLVMQNNGLDNHAIAANGPSVFAAKIASGGAYNVTVLTQPSSPSQTCTVTGGSGTVGAGTVSGIAIACTTKSYNVGVTVSGLAGSGLVLQNNGGDNHAVGVNGSSNFTTKIASGATYNVTAFAQPINPSQTCAVTGGSGTVGGADVNITVTCTTNTYNVGLTVSGLTGSGLVLQNNGGDNHAVAADGSFNFTTKIASGATYSVTVLTQPGTPNQHCVLTGSTGTVTTADVNVNVVCRTVGHVAYVVNDSGGVSAFTINPATGALTSVAGSPFATGAYPVSVAVDAHGKFAYVANADDGTLSAYTIDAGTGALTPLAALAGNPYTVGTNPEFVTVDPTGKFVYVANYDDNTISAFTIDATSGALTAVAGSPFSSLGLNPKWVTVNPTGRFVYVLNYAGAEVSTYSIDATTGALTPLPGSPFFLVARYNPFTMAMTPNGQYAYVGNADGSHHISGISLDPLTGAPTALPGSPYFGVDFAWAVVIDPSGRFIYAADVTQNSVTGYTIDSVTGDLTLMVSGPVATHGDPRSVSIDPSGQFAYVANRFTGDVSAYTIDAVTGALTPVVAGGPFITGTHPVSIAISP